MMFLSTVGGGQALAPDRMKYAFAATKKADAKEHPRCSVASAYSLTSLPA
jgi:hypothetical protein